ncbi:MAG: MarR family winged helix-turn-helix transcriptional regulator [Promethearchaeota archaeon]
MSDNYNILFKEFIQFLESIREMLVTGWPELIHLIKEKVGDKDPYGRYFQIILFIGNNKRCNMTEFAEYFDLSPATATGMVDRLVQLNFVQRESSQKDRRKVEIFLTEQGLEIYELAHSFQEKEVKKIIDLLTDEEIGFLIRISRKINATLAN